MRAFPCFDPNLCPNKSEGHKRVVIFNSVFPFSLGAEAESGRPLADLRRRGGGQPAVRRQEARKPHRVEVAGSPRAVFPRLQVLPQLQGGGLLLAAVLRRLRRPAAAAGRDQAEGVGGRGRPRRRRLPPHRGAGIRRGLRHGRRHTPRPNVRVSSIAPSSLGLIFDEEVEGDRSDEEEEVKKISLF